MVLNPPPAGRAGSRPDRADGPLVLTAHGQLKQLSAADFPVPAEPVDRLRIPNSFSERSPKHRRDLVSAMRCKMAGRDLDRAAPTPAALVRADPTACSTGRRSGRDGRRRRRHRRAAPAAAPAPVPRLPRPGAARQVRRALLPPAEGGRRPRAADRRPLARDRADLRPGLRACSTSSATWTATRSPPTASGCTRLYSELDLLAAECLRRGFWEGLNPAELAACVSVLSFESRRQAEDAGPPRLPKGPVRDVLTAMAGPGRELDQLEQRNGLSFLREPDAGFVWAAYRWVRGAKLEDVLDSVPGLTPGDFVRSVKQLIDLLDQIAAAAQNSPTPRTHPNGTRPETEPPETEAPRPAETGHPETAEPQSDVAPRDRDVAATAHAAIDALRRGVVAYTSLTD